MNRTEEWDFFVHQLQERAMKEHHDTHEHELRKARQAYLDDLMSNELTAEQRVCIEEIFFEIISFHDREADLLYRQGMKDSVRILKNLEVLA